MEPAAAALKVLLDLHVKLIFHSVRQKHVLMVELVLKDQVQLLDVNVSLVLVV